MVKRIDLTGEKYSHLSVLKEVEQDGYMRRWLCQCDCGSDPVIVRMSNLRNGHTTSCGCVQSKRVSLKNTHDLTGQVFSRLTVLRRSDTKPYKSRHVFWECICECSTPTVVDGVRLKDGTTKSCGCLKVDKGHELIIYNQTNSFIDGVYVPVLKSKRRSDNNTGYKGVTRIIRKGITKYRAGIVIKGKRYTRGDFNTPEDAYKERMKLEKQYHFPYLHGKNPPAT